MDLDNLVKQVQILSETVNAQIARNDELAKSYQVEVEEMRNERLAMQQERENLMITNEALTRSLQELDRHNDDLMKVTAFLTQHDQTLRELLQEGS